MTKPPAMPEQVWLIYAKLGPELRRLSFFPRLSFSPRLSAEEKGSGWVAEPYVIAALQQQPPAIADAIHYPGCWDTAAYPTLESALHEMTAWFKCSNDECQQRAAVSDAEIDVHLDLILRAAGSALRHYTLPKSIDDLRAALRSAILALRPQAVPMTDAPVAYFSYGEDSGYLEHVTAEDASKHAREEITAYRSDAMHDNEWPSEVDSVCWGVVLQKATAVDNSEEAGRESFDYELGPHHGITQRADATRQPTKEQSK